MIGGGFESSFLKFRVLVFFCCNEQKRRNLHFCSLSLSLSLLNATKNEAHGESESEIVSRGLSQTRATALLFLFLFFFFFSFAQQTQIELGKKKEKMEKKSSSSSSVPRFLRVREFLASRLPETELLVNLLKRKLGEDRFGADAVDGKARRRASSPRSWKFWQREERARKRKREEEGESDSWRRRFCREKRRKETKKERWSKERGKLATHEWLAKRCARSRFDFRL